MIMGRLGSGGGRGLGVGVGLGSGSLSVVVNPSLLFVTDKGTDL